MNKDCFPLKAVTSIFYKINVPKIIPDHRNSPEKEKIMKYGCCGKLM